MVKKSSFSQGKFDFAINILAICWICLAVVLFCMLVSLPVQAQTMNYASVVFAGFAIISIIWYFIHGRKGFNGPPVPQDVEPEEEVVFDMSVVESNHARNGDVENKALEHFSNGHTK